MNGSAEVRRARAEPGPGVPEHVLTPLILDMAVLFDRVDALMNAQDWPTRRVLAENVNLHLNMVWAHVDDVRRWLAQHSPDVQHRADEGQAAGEPGELS